MGDLPVCGSCGGGYFQAIGKRWRCINCATWQRGTEYVSTVQEVGKNGGQRLDRSWIEFEDFFGRDVTPRQENPLSDWCAGCDNIVERCYMRWDFGMYRCMNCLGIAVNPIMLFANQSGDPLGSGCDSWAN